MQTPDEVFEVKGLGWKHAVNVIRKLSGVQIINK
jgi:hypothetical protein